MNETAIKRNMQQLHNSFSFRDDQTRRLAIVVSHFLTLREELIQHGITANTDLIAAQLTNTALALPSK